MKKKASLTLQFNTPYHNDQQYQLHLKTIYEVTSTEFRSNLNDLTIPERQAFITALLHNEQQSKKTHKLINNIFIKFSREIFTLCNEDILNHLYFPISTAKNCLSEHMVGILNDTIISPSRQLAFIDSFTKFVFTSMNTQMIAIEILSNQCRNILIALNDNHEACSIIIDIILRLQNNPLLAKVITGCKKELQHILFSPVEKEFTSDININNIATLILKTSESRPTPELVEFVKLLINTFDNYFDYIFIYAERLLCIEIIADVQNESSQLDYQQYIHIPQRFLKKVSPIEQTIFSSFLIKAQTKPHYTTFAKKVINDFRNFFKQDKDDYFKSIFLYASLTQLKCYIKESDVKSAVVFIDTEYYDKEYSIMILARCDYNTAKKFIAASIHKYMHHVITKLYGKTFDDIQNQNFKEKFNKLTIKAGLVECKIKAENNNCILENSVDYRGKEQEYTIQDWYEELIVRYFSILAIIHTKAQHWKIYQQIITELPELAKLGNEISTQINNRIIEILPKEQLTTLFCSNHNKAPDKTITTIFPQLPEVHIPSELMQYTSQFESKHSLQMVGCHIEALS